MDYRNELVLLANRLKITDDNIAKLEVEQIEALCAERRVNAGVGDDMDNGILDGFADGMAIVRWEQGTVTPCPVCDITQPQISS